MATRNDAARSLVVNNRPDSNRMPAVAKKSDDTWLTRMLSSRSGPGTRPLIARRTPRSRPTSGLSVPTAADETPGSALVRSASSCHIAPRRACASRCSSGVFGFTAGAGNVASTCIVRTCARSKPASSVLSVVSVRRNSAAPLNKHSRQRHLNDRVGAGQCQVGARNRRVDAARCRPGRVGAGGVDCRRQAEEHGGEGSQPGGEAR